MPRSSKDCEIIYSTIDEFFSGHSAILDQECPEKPLPVYDSFCAMAVKHCPIALTVTASPKWKHKGRFYGKRQVDNQYKTIYSVYIDAIKDSIKDIASNVCYYVFPELTHTRNVHLHATLYFENVEPHPYYCRKIQDKLIRYGLDAKGIDIDYIKYPSKWFAYCRKEYGKIPLRPKTGTIYSLQSGSPDFTERSEAN